MDETLQIQDTTRIKTSGQGVFSDLGEESVIMHVTEGVYYGLNKVSASIWKNIQEPIPFSDLIDLLLEQYEVERSACEEDTRSLLLQLHQKDLVTFDA